MWPNTLQYNYDSRSYLRCGLGAHGNLQFGDFIAAVAGLWLWLWVAAVAVVYVMFGSGGSDDGAHSEVLACVAISVAGAARLI